MSSKTDQVQVVEAYSADCLNVVRDLFQEYARSLQIDLCFQGFEQELAELPGRYAPPEGRLFLASDGQDGAGCVALRRLSNGVCEMKRLYVRPAFRGQGLGRLLAQRVISAAREIGYRQMRLDTLASMTEATKLYEALGFSRIAPYYDNPNDCAMFFGLNL